MTREWALNKFLVLKAATAELYDKALARVRDAAATALSFHPDQTYLIEDRERLTFFASYALSDSGGFRKDYVARRMDRVFAFDGMPYTSGIDTRQSVATQIDEAWASDQSALENVFGTWALLRLDRSELRVLSDFTGMTPLFYWQDKQYLAVSTRQMLLTTACGVQQPNLQGLAWLTGQANLIGSETAWLGVRHLPPQWTLTVSRRRGDLTPVLTQREIWSRETDPSVNQTDIDGIAQRLLEQCNALNRLPLPPLQVDITGGLDSRLTAALLAGSALKEKIGYLQTRGIENGHEIQVGRAVAAELGVEHRAITASSTIQTADWILETLRASTFRYEASICPSDGLILPGKQSRIAVTGAAGEIYRRHCKPHMKVCVRDRKQLLALFQDYHQKTDPLNIETDAIRDFQQRSMQQLAAGYADQGVPLNDVTDVFFMRYRMPLWNGPLLNNIYGSVRAYPLVNYHAARFAFAKGYESRVADRLHFELMLAINPKLCAMPFLGFVWPKEYGSIAAKKGVTLPKAEFPVTGPGGMLQASGGSQLSRMMNDGWQLCRSYLMDHPNSPIWSILDRARVEKLFGNQAGSIKNVVESKQVFAALGIQCALLGDYERRRDGNADLTTAVASGTWSDLSAV